VSREFLSQETTVKLLGRLVNDELYSDPVYDPPTLHEIEGIGLIAEPIKSTERFRVYGQP
jgi:hypothetical protein